MTEREYIARLLDRADAFVASVKTFLAGQV